MAKRETQTGKEQSANQVSRPLLIVVCLTAVTTVCTLLFLAVVLSRVIYLVDLQKERKSLLELTDKVEEDFGENKEVAGNKESKETFIPSISAFDAELRKINSDYLCWLKIDGTAIDYPVVRGEDNEQYLSKSFYGEENAYGTLFMDYRNKGENVPHIIIYGHNTKTGDMFGSLRNFLDEQYMASHPIITLKTNDRVVEFEVFAARKTDISDPAYYLDFSEAGSFSAFTERCGAPAEAVQILTLSTCVSAGNDDERIVVQGMLYQ